MHASINRATLDRLVALGRSRGMLTVQDLKDHLPIEALSADTIALVVAHLEDAGIAVELDDNLLSGQGRTNPPDTPGIELHSPAGSSPPPLSLHTTAVGELGPAEFRGRDPRVSVRRKEPGAHRAVLTAGIFVLLLLGLGLLTLG
jgi:hypothetical protein